MDEIIFFSFPFSISTITLLSHFISPISTTILILILIPIPIPIPIFILIFISFSFSHYHHSIPNVKYGGANCVGLWATYLTCLDEHNYNTMKCTRFLVQYDGCVKEQVRIFIFLTLIFFFSFFPFSFFLSLF